MDSAVLVCGDRNWTDVECIRSWLSKLQDQGFTTVIEGEARGADSIARDEAKDMGYQIVPFPADWDKYGRAAGPIRNRRMLDQKPGLVLAFHAHIQTSRGTIDTLREAQRRGINTILVDSARCAVKQI
jgi:hypothetical protein